MSSAISPMTYKIIRVPRASSRLADLTTKFRNARLSALEIDPVSFFSQHAVESALPLEVWTNRLFRETNCLICVATSSEFTPLADNDDETALIEGEWVGFAAVRGPLSYKDYYSNPEMGLPVPEDPSAEARWHIYDIYTLPAHRGQGLAKRLVHACIDTAVQHTQLLEGDYERKQIARIRLFMNPKNPWLVRFYEGAGFRGVGKVTLEEGFRANALDDSVPEDIWSSEELREVWHTRFGLAMEQVQRVG